ncbi:class I SAM-dependent methyltransferase [Paenibacillus artemisiicola]|uniref:class I SAM-dependent methyltransferase n=1 Tax=Paenibacillus artemisiicola TaxID=1172618 RepID=UPI001F0B0E3C|nr:class I SAM-dependent methyltransferase [Paenibacillus artemisiicola]
MLQKSDLARAYDREAERRSNSVPAEWKRYERESFARLLRSEGKRTLLEIGSGPGTDGRYFQSRGLEVDCVDLSPEMVRHCREIGLRARVMDFYALDFDEEAFDAVYALNCLLHVPKRDIGGVLAGIRRVLKPNGLFFMGLYGGADAEGVWEQDAYEPKRFFASYTDDEVRARVRPYFGELAFRAIPVPGGGPHFQSLTLRRREDG